MFIFSWLIYKYSLLASLLANIHNLFMVTLFAQENFCGAFSSMVTYFFSAYTKYGYNSHTCAFLLFTSKWTAWFLKKGPYTSDNKSHVLSGKNHTFHMNMFLILLIYHLINVFFDFPGAYSRNYTVYDIRTIYIFYKTYFFFLISQFSVQ